MDSGTDTTSTEQEFQCHACSGATYRVVVRGKFGADAHRRLVEEAAAEYACTNRGHGRFTRVVECTRCRVRALHPVPTAADIHHAYADVEDANYLSIEPHRRIAFERLEERIHRRTTPPGRLLDVGCYTGLFPVIAKEHGWDAWGIEPSAWAARIASERLPGHIHEGFLNTTSFEPASFDVITSWDVIEHMTDPKGNVLQMARLLRPGGWLFLSTMSSEAPIVRLLGARWPWYMMMHLFYFTPKTLAALLHSAGLRSEAAEPYPHYTSLRYVLWKLEPYLGPLALLSQRVARKFGIGERTVKVDLGDFFLIAAQRPRDGT